MTNHQRKRIVARAIVSAGIAITGLGLSTGSDMPSGVAHADVPPSGPFRWCPGDPPVETGNKRVNPVRWDEGVCHEYWMVYHGQGNVAQNVWDGPNPPGPPPGHGFVPPPPIPPGWCYGFALPSPCPPGVQGPVPH